MATTTVSTQQSTVWWVFLLQGLAGVLLGVMLITEPGATLLALTTFLGFYWLITRCGSTVLKRFIAAGFEVCEAASVLEALTVLDERPDMTVLLTDVQMPGNASLITKQDGINIGRKS